MKYREVARMIRRDGWRHVRTRGSHRIYRHPIKPGIVIISGHPGRDVPKGILDEILKQAGLK